MKFLDTEHENTLKTIIASWRKDARIIDTGEKLADLSYMSSWAFGIASSFFPKLIENNMIKEYDAIPQAVIITELGLNYFENKANTYKQGNTINIDTLIAENSNFILGDAINSTFSIDNSIHELQRKIEDQGGEDKETLNELLLEVREMIENIELTKQIPKNSGIVKRLSSHLQKHGWFYAEVIALLGATVLKIALG